MHHASSIMHHASCIVGRRLRFGMLTALTNLRSTKVLWYMEENLRWKTKFSGRRPLMEDDLRWKTTFGKRQPSVEDILWWKMTFGGRHPSIEYNLRWKTSFGGRMFAYHTILYPFTLKTKPFRDQF